MSASTTSRRAPLFVQQLHRAAAQRGKLDPLYQELSDRFTGSLQRLYPVWALIGPGLSDPGHIEIHSRQIYLDADELLGPRQQLLAGPPSRRAVLRTFGVALHETSHAKHTKRWVVEDDMRLAASDDPDDRQLAVDRRLLEEPRMEAHGTRDFAPDSIRGRFVTQALRAACSDVLLPAFAGELAAAAASGTPVSRDLAGRATVYLKARTHYGILDAAGLGGLEAIWRRVLGAADLRALDDLYARLIWIADGDLNGLDDAARRYRAIIGAPDPDVASAAGGDAPPTGSLTEALEHALEQARDEQLQQLEEDVDLSTLLEQAASGDTTTPAGGGSGTGAPSGRMPDRGVDRPPAPDEIQHARRYATRLRQALTLGQRQIDKRTPGGRFVGRAWARAQAQRASGRPPSSHPWEITRRQRAPIEAPHVGLIIDTSGSMGVHEYALGPIAWIITDALRQVDGRCAIALFGNSVELLSDGTRPLAQVPGIRTGGGTAFGGDAIDLVAEQLEMTNPRRPRLVYVLSDGAWYDTAAGVARIRWLADHGVPTIHLSIGTAPLSVEAERISVITDPADALDHIAADTVAALQAHGRRPTS